ncbi:hypothetical protein [Aurantibacter sp.]|uniref:hypothetical protein n=1 Tax=Aurantibacter sp. TaxID=2807103 RepID=UPI0035C80987
MKTTKKIEEKTAAAFNSLDTISAVKVSPFFKERTLNLLFKEEEQKVTLLERFLSPQIQFVAIMAIVLINVVTIYNYSESNYNSDLNTFSESYNLSVSEESLIQF